ncbi:protein rolling stone isoform X2 [Bactrocera oleae]
MRETSGICHQLCHSLAKEFQREKFSLTQEPSEVFFKSQWQCQPKSIIWLIYRWLFAATFTGGVVGSLIQSFDEGKWFIYLTNWGFLLCMYTSVFGAILVTIFYYSKDNVRVPPWALKLYWASYITTLSVATTITFLYWIFIFPSYFRTPLDVFNLWEHAFNSILMILDHMLVAFPVRLLHFVYPVCMGLIYGMFTAIYYLAGGVDPYGNHFIYEIQDWSNPGSTILTLIGSLIVVSVFCFMHFGLYKLRTFIYNKRQNSKFTLSV